MNEIIYRWRKLPDTGSHSFKYDGDKYRLTPGDTIDCPLFIIGSFKDEYDCIGQIVDGVPVEVETKEEEKGDFTLKVVPRGRGYYNVVNPDNPSKPINEKGLRKKAAYELAGIEMPKARRRKKNE